jgi:multidrug efflux pump subunit AcrB
MKIASFSVKNYQFTLVVFLLVAALGINSLLNMPRAEDPEFDAPFFTVVVIYPGASPEDVERQVADPLERYVSESEDLKDLYSTSGDGVLVMRVEYKYNSDADEKNQELQRAINLARNEFPDGIYSIYSEQFKPSGVKILQVALVSETAPYHALEAEAKALQERLERINSLKQVEREGFPERLVRVSLDIEKMAQQRIPVNQVLQALQSENLNVPGGNVLLGARKFNIRTSGSYEDLDEVRNTIVWSSGQKTVYLRDVAAVDFNYGEETYLARLNGRRCVFVTAALKPGNNIQNVQTLVQPALDEFQKQLPASMAMVKIFDQADTVAKRLSGLGRDFLIAIFLVSLTLLPLGLRAAAVVMISIPLSLFMGLTALDALGFSINQLSIVGMVVALGILVDDSIVVVENIERWLRDGWPKREAAIEATKQIGLAVVGCTATLILAFLPLVFLPEAAGDFIKSIPMAVISSVAASLLVSLTIVPFLGSRILSSKHSPEGNLFLRLLKKLIAGTYSRLLEKALHYPVITLMVAALIFGGVLALVPTVGFSLFPKSEKPQFMVNVTTAPGSHIYETDSIVRYVERRIDTVAAVRYYASNVGKGNPRIYYNEFQKNEDPEYGQIWVQLQPDIRPEEKTAIIDRWREWFKEYPNAKIEVKDYEQGPPQTAPVEVYLYGENLDTLRSIAGKVEDILRSIPGTIYIHNPLKTQKTDLKIAINKDKASLLGVPTIEIDRVVRLAAAGLELGAFREANGEDRPIVATIPKGKFADLTVFDNLYVNNVQGTPIPLRQLADIEFETSPANISHFDKERNTTLRANVQTGFLAANINRELQEKLEAFPFPNGYRFSLGGEVKASQDSFGGIGAVVFIAVFGIIAVLILEFGTFKSTLIVLSVIPLGVIGAILALLLTGNTFSFVAAIGFIALMGIEVKNTILLVDFTNQLRVQGRPLETAIREAGEIRFVPIVLTSMTAIGGLLPLALENNPLYTPLAWVLIGGLISSTLLSRIVTPVLYKLIPPRVGEG